MAYNETLANRVRERFSELENVEEKYMMGGLVFMYNAKMCVGIMGDDLMCRIDPALMEILLEHNSSRVLTFTGRASKGFILVDETGTRTKKELDYWLKFAIDFNKFAKSSRKK